MKRMGLTLIDIMLVIAITVLALSILLSTPSPWRHYHDGSVRCRSNLHQLSLFMKLYADDNNGRYPTMDKWCDLLTKNYLPGVDPDLLFCPGARDKITQDSNQSSYVLNKNVLGMKVSEIPPDMVLLFEGPVGWNQVGGPELLTTEYHKDDGVGVSFTDLSVKFVSTNELAELKWKPNQNNN
ncbi:MAG: type II secretion system protein [Planctomycetota bacterium]